MKNERRQLLGAATGALALAAMPGLRAQPAAGGLKLGAVLSMSGPGAAFGIPMRDALQVTLAEINKAGGVRGQPVEIVFHDDRTDPAEAGRRVTQLITSDRVAAVIGPGTGGNALAVGPVMQRLRVPLLSPAGTIAVTDKKNAFFGWVFRTTPSDAENIKAILSYAAGRGARKLGIFYQEDAYGKTGVDVAQQLAQPLALDIRGTVSAPFTATDLSSQAIKLREAGVEAVFMQVTVAALGVAFLKAARQVGLNVPVYANSGLAQRSFAEAAGSVAEGLRVLSIGNLAFQPSPGEKKLAELLLAAGKQPQGWAELVITNGLNTAVAAARSLPGEITGEAMRDAVEKLCGIDSYMRGKGCFGAGQHDGWGADSLVVTELVGGKLRTLD